MIVEFVSLSRIPLKLVIDPKFASCISEICMTCSD